MELLGVLRGSKHAARIKTLKKFQDYVTNYDPEFYDDDVELLLLVGLGCMVICWATHECIFNTMRLRNLFSSLAIRRDHRHWMV